MQNITLLKESTTNTDPPSISQLKSVLKQKSIQSNQLHNQIEKHRKQIKELSDSVSKFIQKKLKPNQVKQRPKLFKQHKSPQLNHLQQQKEKIYRQIFEVKQIIKQIKNQEQPETVVQYEKKQNVLKEVLNNIQESKQNKKYLIHQLNQNKSKIFELNDNSNLKSTIQNQNILQDLRRQFKIYDKQAYLLSTQEIIKNMYYFQIKSALQKPIQSVKQYKPVDYKTITQKINEINKILQERNKIQKQNQTRLSQLQQKINNLSQKNKNCQIQIRSFQGKQLRKNLDEKFYKSRNSKSTSQIKRIQQNYSSVNQKTHNSHVKQKNVKKEKISQFITQVQQTDEKQQILEIGDLTSDQFSIIEKDQIQIGKVNRLTFLYNKKNIVGIKACYLTKKGLKEGAMHSIKLLQTFVQIDINPNNIQEICFPKNSKNMFIAFNLESGKQQFGLQYVNQLMKKVRMNNKIIKSFQVMIQNKKQNSRIKGIRFFIEKTASISNLDFNQKQKSIQQIKARSVADLRSSKVSSQSSHVSRKIVLGGLKKINQPKMDHRLLIGRKKLV